MFSDRKLVIATMHKKEEVIAPIMEKELGVTCITPTSLNTDIFGTFSGEIERKDSPIDSARKKCLKAMDITSCDLAIASEGSFGPHPNLLFVPCDDEFLLFLDKKNNIEIIVRDLSLDTNFNSTKIKTKSDLDFFLKKTKFPSHGVIVKAGKTLKKGITNIKDLYEIHESCINNKKSYHIETDMRAMYNPTRMKVIENLTLKLAQKIKSLCPNCNTPGFGITDTKPGLPCHLCGFPTKSTKSHIYQCNNCKYKIEKEFPYNKLKEDPMYCDNCNP